MRKRFEFSLQTIAAAELSGGVDPSLALMGSQGWEVRGLTCAANGDVLVALQRPLDEELPLPDGATLAASLEEPLAIAEGDLR
jgi:hypothetical protein